MSEVCIVLTTVAAEATLKAIVADLLDARLAACVQALPIRSFYTWDGARQEEAEQLLLIKARRADYEAIAAAIAALHDYEVPEILCLDAAEVAPSYLGWLMAATERGTPGPRG